MQATWPQVLFTDEFRQTVGKSRVLLVGAGGIGCEVLKTLVLTGFRHISIVDLDIIEISNLNRQFLFRNAHVGTSKAVTAAETVEQFLPEADTESAMNPHARKKLRSNDFEYGVDVSPNRKKKGSLRRQKSLHIIPHYANIKDPHFNVDFYKGFDVVLNGLDNLSARRHVNRLCFAADVPLVESGTTGYEGSVTVHIQGHSHCYECEEKPVQKSFPICTIRNTPEKLIHCVVWAKDLLFARLFGKQDGKSDLDEEMNADDISGHKKRPNSFFLKTENETVVDYAIRIFTRVFDQDIVSIIQMKDLWKSRRMPHPIEWPPEETIDDLLNMTVRDPYEIPSKVENVAMFLNSIVSLYNEHRDEIGSLVFDKDDDLAVQFVTAAANLRAICYFIDASSMFEIKGMAGNIIHAVATTNAIVAGLVITEACKILCGCRHTVKESFVGKHCLIGPEKRKRDILVKSMLPPKSNPNCVTCGRSLIPISLDTNRMTLHEFVEKVVKNRLCVTEPSIVCGGFMYEEGEGLEEDEKEEYNTLLPKHLSALPGNGLTNGAILDVQSQLQQFSCKIILTHTDDINEEDHPDQFILHTTIPEQPTSEVESAGKGPKRKRSEGAADAQLVNETVQEVVVLSDDHNSDEDMAVEFTPKKKKFESDSADPTKDD